MQEKRKRSKTNIIVAAVTIVLVVVAMIFWKRYEAKHNEELRSSLLTTSVADVEDVGTAGESEPDVAEPERIIPKDPEKILVMAEDAFKDEGYFKPGNILKGFHVYSLLKKCLDCDGDPDKVEGLATRLKERSSKTYGAWHVERDLLDDLDDSVSRAKQQI